MHSWSPVTDANVPFLHVEHSVAPYLSVAVPAGHGMHCVVPYTDEYVPGKHGQHGSRPLLLNCPGAHRSSSAKAMAMKHNTSSSFIIVAIVVLLCPRTHVARCCERVVCVGRERERSGSEWPWRHPPLPSPLLPLSLPTHCGRIGRSLGSCEQNFPFSRPGTWHMVCVTPTPRVKRNFYPTQ